MPLLHRKPFVRQKPPEDLDPDEEVFLCKITHEIFRSYDEFFERTILCNSLVWSCALTGRAGLTYLEAVESERRARLSLQNFPVCLLTPLLLLVKQNHSKRLSELCEDVYGFTKERYFPGETVDVSARNGARLVCRVMQVLSPHSCANGSLADPCSGSNGSLAKAEDDSIVISDSDEEQNTPPQMNGKRKKPLSPSVFRYSVKPLKDDSEPFTVKASQISRRKNVLSRERLKLLFKQHCEPQNGSIALKESTVSHYSLSEQSFSQFFPDDPPLFSPSSRGSPAQAGLSLLKAAEEKLKLLQQKEEMAAQKTHKKKDKDKHREEKQKEKEEKRREKEERQRDRLKEDREKQREELRQKRREEKEQRRLEKEREREKLKEEKKKYAERLKLLNKRREDLECDDLKDLPSPVPVRTRLPADLFGEALMVLEFLRAFGEVFELKDEFPEGLSLEILEEALVGSDPEGPLCELLFFFLSAIFQASDEESEENQNQDQDQSEAVDEAPDSAPSSLAAMTTAAGAWPQLHQGRSLRKLDLDSCTLTEILRLQLLSATETDDPCLELSRSEPGLIQNLSRTAVYDLAPGEKLRILNALIGKLLTLGLSRDLIEDCVEEQKAARQELREIRAEQHRRDREEAALRVRLRKEERLREQELRMKEKEERLREQENISQNGAGPKPNPEDQQNQGKSKDVLKEPEPDPKPSVSPEELQKEQEKVGELLERIQRAASCTSLLPLGRDRWFRRYWLLPSASVLLVEEDGFGLPWDMIRPRSRSEHAQNVSSQEEELSGDSAPHQTPDPSDSTPGPSDSAPGPSDSAPRWWFFSSEAQLEQLLEALNPRGNRENGLKEALLQERDRITAALQQSPSSRFCLTEEQTFPECTAAETVMEARLRDLLLDIEDRVHQGTLGMLKVPDRQLWRSALETGSYQSLSDGCEEQRMEVDPARDPRDPRDSVSLDAVNVRSSVQALASALAQIERGIDRRFLKAPLVDEDSKKEQKTKKNKKKDEDQASEDGSDSGRVCKSVLERWRESLQSCSSLSQVFVHLSTLERSILWSRSVLNARCRICRRKGDADNMLLCDGCDRGHHTHCLRPKLKSIPGGDWFCPDCRPKQRSSRVPSRQRSSIDEDSEEEESEEEEETEEEESDEEEEESDEQQEALSNKKNTAPPPKGKNQSAVSKSQQATPRSQQATPKATGSRSSGKKPSPPSSKPPKPPSRGSRSSSRLSHEAPNGSKPQTGPHPGPAPRPPRPVLSSSSSSSRRSSGRHHGVHELSACEQIVVELVRHQDSWPFMKLVSRTQVPDYYDIIKKPIALSIIREKVNNCEYQSAAEFVCDVELMFSNCLQYNPRHSNEAKAGLRLQSFFHSTLVQLGLGTASSDGGPAAKRSRH